MDIYKLVSHWEDVSEAVGDYFEEQNKCLRFLWIFLMTDENRTNFLELPFR